MDVQWKAGENNYCMGTFKKGFPPLSQFSRREPLLRTNIDMMELS